MYHKAKLLEMAIDLLEKESKIHLENVETVDVDSTTYDDGSSSLTITVNRPSKSKSLLEHLGDNLFGYQETDESQYEQEEAIEFMGNIINVVDEDDNLIASVNTTKQNAIMKDGYKLTSWTEED